MSPGIPDRQNTGRQNTGRLSTGFRYFMLNGHPGTITVTLDGPSFRNKSRRPRCERRNQGAEWQRVFPLSILPHRSHGQCESVLELWPGSPAERRSGKTAQRFSFFAAPGGPSPIGGSRSAESRPGHGDSVTGRGIVLPSFVVVCATRHVSRRHWACMRALEPQPQAIATGGDRAPGMPFGICPISEIDLPGFSDLV